MQTTENENKQDSQEKLLKIDNEIKKLKDDEKLKIKELKEEVNKPISKLCNDIYYQIKWSDPKLPLEQQKHLNNYCTHLATKGSQVIFNDINEIREWNKKNSTGLYSKVTRNINSLCQKLYLIVAEKETKISTLQNENILAIEKLTTEKDRIRRNDLLAINDKSTMNNNKFDNIMKPEVEDKASSSPVKDFQLRSTQKQLLKLEEEKKISEKLQKDLLLELQLYKEKCIEQERKEKQSNKTKLITQQHQKQLSTVNNKNMNDNEISNLTNDPLITSKETMELLPQICNNNIISSANTDSIKPIFILQPKKSSVSPLRKYNNNDNNMEVDVIISKDDKEIFANSPPFTQEFQKKINERYTEESYQQILYNHARSDGSIFIQQFLEALASISVYITSEHAMKIFRDVGLDNKGSVLVNSLMYYLSKSYMKKEYNMKKENNNNNNIEYIWISELFGTKELSLYIVLNHHSKPDGFIDIGNFYASLNLLNIDLNRIKAYHIFEQVCKINENDILNLKSKESIAKLKKGKIHIKYLLDYLNKEIPDLEKKKKILKYNNNNSINNNINSSCNNINDNTVPIISKSLPISFNKIENIYNKKNNTIQIDNKKNEIKLEKKSIDRLSKTCT